MIAKISNLPDNVLGFRASGTITARDYETVLIPAVEAQFAAHGHVRFLYHIGEDFAHFEAGALWDDTKVGLRHLKGWERVAVVSDVEWIRAAVGFFRLMIPGHVRVFHNRDYADAAKWVAA